MVEWMDGWMDEWDFDLSAQTLISPSDSGAPCSFCMKRSFVFAASLWPLQVSGTTSRAPCCRNSPLSTTV